jgi:hypothetical protein
MTPSRDGRVLRRAPSSITCRDCFIGPDGDGDGAACQRGAEPDLLAADPQVARRRHQPVGLYRYPREPASAAAAVLTERAATDLQRPCLASCALRTVSGKSVWTATGHPSPTALHVIVAHDLDALEQKITEAELAR